MSKVTKTVVHVSGWRACPYFQKCANAVTAMEHLYPSKITADIHESEHREAYQHWLKTYSSSGAQTPVRDVLGPAASKHTSSPFVWKNENEFIGGCDATLAYLRKTFFSSDNSNTASMSQSPSPKRVKLDNVETDVKYDYDLIVIGGGSGGLATSKAAAKLGAKVAVLDYVKPSPLGTTWGLGGTCVNVGCIPKKLMHQSAMIGKIMRKDAAVFGWTLPNTGDEHTMPAHDWSKIVANVQDYIHSLNFKYRVDLRDKSVKYENFLGKFTDANTLECTNPKKNKTKSLTARRFVIATGGRPRPLSCPGGELAISSDDIFQLASSPGDVLVIGGAYVALECAGFLKGMGFPVTVLVRSILLRGFDRDMATRIGAYMADEEKVAFEYECVPTKMEKMANGRIRVTWKNTTTQIETSNEYDTVLNATGRIADLSNLGLEAAGVVVDAKSGKLETNDEQTNVPHIYAIGDVLADKPELTPVAIQAGRLLAQRLYQKEFTTTMNYDRICTAVFTPIEYGCCGWSEEEAVEKVGEGMEVYHQSFTPLEWSLSHDRTPDTGYVKVIVDTNDMKRVVGFHYLGPNAGEITQAVGVAMQMDATYEDFIRTVGIHPTTAEVFTTLEITKASGADASAGGC